MPALRLTFVASFASLALSAFGLAACGGAPSAEPEVLTPVDVVADVTAPPPCPFDLDAIRGSGVSVRYTLDGGPGEVRTEISGGEGREVIVTWSERSVDGFDEGIERYLCTPAGLALIEVTTTEGGVAFAPPVLVLPGLSGEGAAAGTLAVHDDARSTVFDARHAWTAADVAPPVPAPTDAAGWRRVQSALIIDVDGAEHAWMTETLWAIDDDRLVVVRRETTTRDADGESTRVEAADRIAEPSQSAGPPPLVIPGR